MFHVISDIMANLYEMWNTIVIAISFCSGKKMIDSLMFIISYHHGIKCISKLLLLEPSNVMLKVIPVIMAYAMIREIKLQLNSALERKLFVHWCLS